jgi:hypothetical protein
LKPTINPGTLNCVCALAGAVVGLAGCGPRAELAGTARSPDSGDRTPPAIASRASAGAGKDRYARFLPDARKTPGAVLEVSLHDVCTAGYTRRVRDVPESVKKQVYTLYGIAYHKPGEYEVDHLISLELGGSNSVANLWPESYLSEPWNAHVKDKLENRLHKLICDGTIDLKTAQAAIASDWIAAYRKYVGPDPGTSARSRGTIHAHVRPADPGRRRSSSAPEPGLKSGKVWVNTRSGVYWRVGSKYYGKTREGAYMPEDEAVRRGYHPPGAAGNGGR